MPSREDKTARQPSTPPPPTPMTFRPRNSARRAAAQFNRPLTFINEANAQFGDIGHNLDGEDKD